MAGNSFGQLFRITTFGESHGAGVGVVIDGCPSGLKLDFKKIQNELNRRRPGQSKLTTSRQELDQVQWLSGLFEGTTTGAPLAAWIANSDQRSQDYDVLKNIFRPSHADYTYSKKYETRDHRGGGRASARETAARVIAGAVAKQLLYKKSIEIVAYVSQVGDVVLENDSRAWTMKQIERSLVRCPERQSARKMEAAILAAKAAGNSLGGVITGVIRGCPVGLGEPVFDKLSADLGKAMLSIQTVKAFEYGSGFAGTRMTGSEHNDIFVQSKKQIVTQTNHSGGIQGGISNGMDIYFRVGFKPVATISLAQNTVDRKGKKVSLKAKGRHDPCVLPRAVVIVESMAALTLLDHLLRSAKTRLKDLL
jgi:chorismate synthase